MTSFPTNLDTFTNPTPYDQANTTLVKHDEQHANANDAIAALEAKVGKDGSAVTSSLDYRMRALESFPAKLPYLLLQSPADGLYYRVALAVVDGILTAQVTDDPGIA